MAKGYNPAMKGFKTGSVADIDEGEILSNFPVEIRKPRSFLKKKTLVDRLHLALWGSEEDQIRDLVVHKGET